MKQKTIIQIWGRWGRGKSSTIKIAYNELLIKYVTPSHTYTFPLPDGDITEVFTILQSSSTYKIGVESAGDFLYYGNPNLNQRLDELVLVEKCDLLICASRVRNDVSYHIEHLASTNGYRLIKVAPYIDEYGHFNRDEVNTAAANNIVTLVHEILTGTL